MIEIDKKRIGSSFPPYIVAEISANHNGKLEDCLKLIKLAKENGASAVKLQTYKPETLTVDSKLDDFVIKEGLWKGKNLFELYEEAHTPWEWHKELFQFAKNQEITIFSSPFDKTAIDLLENLNCPAYKIASFEILDHELIHYAASKNKPVILSTGMASKEEIHEACDVVKSAGNNQIIILHCVSGYPSKPSDYNINTIKDMQKEFKCEIGLSDHTISNSAAIASIAFGACFIEKHFTLDRNRGGPDDSFSMEPKDLKHLVNSSNEAYEAIGKVNYELSDSEKGNLIFRRSLYFIKDLEPGDVINEEHIRCIRPGFGMKPKHLREIIGMKIIKKVEKFTPVKKEYFE